MNDPSHFFFFGYCCCCFSLASLLLWLPLLLPDGPSREVSQLCLFTFHRCEGRQSYSWRGRGVTNLNTRSHYSYLKDWGKFSQSPFVSTSHPMLFSYPVLFCCHDWGTPECYLPHHQFYCCHKGAMEYLDKIHHPKLRTPRLAEPSLV